MKNLKENGVIYPSVPVTVNSVVDSSAAITDTSHPNYVPQDSVEFMVAVQRLLDLHSGLNIPDLYKIIKSSVDAKTDDDEEFPGDNMSDKEKQVEETIRKVVRKMLKEAPASKQRGTNPMGGAKEYGPSEFEADKKWLQNWFAKNKNLNVPGEEDDTDDSTKFTKKIRGTKDEQAGTILQTLKDEFGVDMSAAQFQNFDKATKFRWFVTAILSEEKPNFLQQTINQYVEYLEDSARETGVLDDELKSELQELPELLLQDPSASPAFSEFLQNEVQGYIDTLSDARLADISQRAEAFFTDVPGGVMKYTRKGAKPAKEDEDVEDIESDVKGEKVPDYEYLRTMSQRRQSSKKFAGGGSPKTGGGSAEERFAAGLESEKWPPEK